MPEQPGHTKRVIVIGDAKMAMDCAKHIIARAELDLRLFVHHAGEGAEARVARFCEEHQVPHLAVRNANDAEPLRACAQCEPALLFSINNFDILRSALLAIPKQGAINFHNGPLPDYRGVNIPSWAIINGEREHGVTWHMVERGIDTGAVVARACFPVGEDDTAISLTFKCIVEGTKLFPIVLDNAASDVIETIRSEGSGRYYSKKDIPNGGYVDLRWPFERISRFMRGLDFRPFENPLAYPRISVRKGFFIATQASRSGEGAGQPPGLVSGITDEGIEVAGADGSVLLSHLLDAELVERSVREIVEQHSVAVGDIIGHTPAEVGSK